MAKKNSFSVSYDLEVVLDDLTDEQAGRLFRAIFAYCVHGKKYAGGDNIIAMIMCFLYGKGSYERGDK
jgi:hypothetical protein